MSGCDRGTCTPSSVRHRHPTPNSCVELLLETRRVPDPFLFLQFPRHSMYARYAIGVVWGVNVGIYMAYMECLGLGLPGPAPSDIPPVQLILP